MVPIRLGVARILRLGARLTDFDLSRDPFTHGVFAPGGEQRSCKMRMAYPKSFAAMGILVAIACLGRAADAAHHAHLWRVWRDLDALETPAARGRRLHASGATSDTHEHTAVINAADTHLHLSYTAVQHEQHTLRLLEPALAPRISAIRCNDTHVTVTGGAGLMDELAGRFVPGAVVTGACEERPFYRITHSYVAHPPSTITFATEHVSLQRAFDALSLNFRWSPPGRPRRSAAGGRAAPPPPPEQEEKGSKAEASEPPPRARRQLFLSEIVEGVGNRLGEGLVNAAGQLIDLAGRIASGLANGIDATDGFSGSFIATVRSHWESLQETLRCADGRPALALPAPRRDGCGRRALGAAPFSRASTSTSS